MDTKPSRETLSLGKVCTAQPSSLVVALWATAELLVLPWLGQRQPGFMGSQSCPKAPKGTRRNPQLIGSLILPSLRKSQEVDFPSDIITAAEFERQAQSPWH